MIRIADDFFADQPDDRSEIGFRCTDRLKNASIAKTMNACEQRARSGAFDLLSIAECAQHMHEQKVADHKRENPNASIPADSTALLGEYDEIDCNFQPGDRGVVVYFDEDADATPTPQMELYEERAVQRDRRARRREMKAKKKKNY